jgi:hypothetical protein
MKVIIGILLIFSVVACNTDKGQGYRENQEEQTAPHDYTQGKDAKEPARTRR